MIDPIQILIIAVITILVILLVIIGIEAYKVLKQTKKTLDRVNNVLDDVETITSSVSVPLSKFSEIAQGFQQGVNIFHFVTKLIDRKKENGTSVYCTLRIHPDARFVKGTAAGP